MKVRLKAEIIDDSGKEMTKTVEIERDVPDIDEFGDPSTFYEVFDRHYRQLKGHCQNSQKSHIKSIKKAN